MKQEQIENFKKLITQHFGEVDEEAQIILKGHLLIEESLYRIISNFVFNPEFIESADLSFYKKIHLARSMSLDNSKSSMWELIIAFNTLRNKTAHYLEIENRKIALQKVQILYEKETKDLSDEIKEIWAKGSKIESLSYTFCLCLGFLTEFENEVNRFKEFVLAADKVINPHRHNRGYTD